MTHTAVTAILISRSIIVTEARVDVLTFLMKNNKSLSSLSEILKIRENKFNRITIYRTLIILSETGLIYKIEVNNRPFYAASRFLIVSDDKPIRPSTELCYFRCESCNAVFSFPYNLRDFKLPTGLKKTGVKLFVTGYCSKCSGNTNNVSHKNQ